jgi:hypothetical protein
MIWLLLYRLNCCVVEPFSKNNQNYVMRHKIRDETNFTVLEGFDRQSTKLYVLQRLKIPLLKTHYCVQKRAGELGVSEPMVEVFLDRVGGAVMVFESRFGLALD